MRVLISGAGIAGLTLAYWLHQAGHDIIIAEKAPNIRTEGYMIDFGGTGWDVAERMGIISAIRERAFPTDSIIYKNAKDNVAARIAIKELFASANVGNNYAALNRRDLVDIIYQTVKDKVAICFSTTVESIEQADDGVTATFNDGSQEDFDILVGCDGIHSSIRQQIFGDEAQFAHYLGYQFAIFEIAPLANRSLGASYHMHVQPGIQIGVFPTQPDKWMLFIAYEDKSGEIPPQGKRAEKLHERLSHLDWLVPEILASLTEDTYIFMDNISQIRLPQWYDNRVVVIGDAAYCPTLVSGQGASMAMAGAYFLAQALESTDTLEQAFQQLEARLRPHIERIQTSAENFASTFIPKDYLRIFIVHWVLRLSNLPMFRSIVGKQFVVESILDRF